MQPVRWVLRPILASPHCILSMEKKLRDWQTFWVYYQLMMTIVLVFSSFHSTNVIFSVLNLLKIVYFTRWKATTTFTSGCAVYPYKKKNLSLTSWKSRTVNIWKSRSLIIKYWTAMMKILTYCHENLDLPSWNFRLVIMKTLNSHHENLDLSPWKYQTVVMKTSTCR